MAEIVKSASDARCYRYAQLEHGLKCVVVSDPLTDVSAAAMCVAAGSLSDPRDVPGLSHFLEHMLFLGTEKYPSEATYHAFIKAHAGQSNAYTAHEETNYFFSVARDSLEPALDIFAQFFVAPLFTESCVDREMRAVDSENAKNLKSDDWRLHQLLLSLSTPTHPFNHFATGNLATLRLPNIRERLIAHYRAHYSQERMTLVVLGCEDVETLMRWCVNRFSAVPVATARVQRPLELPFPHTQLATLTKVVSVMDRKVLVLVWQLPGVQGMYASKPQAYISHLLGHEGRNTAVAILKEEGLIEGLHASGDSYSSLHYSLFHVSISLTDRGLQSYERVLEVLFQYILTLQRVGAVEWVFQEIRDISRAEFRFKSQGSPLHYVQRLASSLRKHPPQHVLTALSLVEHYRPDLISRLLSLLAPTNAMVFLTAKDLGEECTLAEPWYGTRYSSQKVASEVMDRLLRPHCVHPALVLDLPPRNSLIPTDFQVLVGNPVPYPLIIAQTDFATVYHKQDATFKKDSILAFANVFCLDCDSSASGHVHKLLWKKVMGERMRELKYMARMAGLRVQVDTQPFGFSITASGFSQHFPAFLQSVFTHIAHFDISENDRKVFLNCLEAVGRKARNHLLEQPYQQALTALADVLFANAHSSQEDFRSALQTVTLERVMQFARQWLSRFRCDWLIMGNVTAERAAALSAACVSALVSARKARPLQSQSVPQSIIARIPSRKSPEPRLALETLLTDRSNRNSCAICYWQLADDTPEARAALLVIDSLLKEPSFTVLRTEKQLGYIVFSTFRCFRQTLGHAILVQSHTSAPAALSRHITDFILLMRTRLASLSDSEFATHRDSVLSSVRKRDVSLEAEFQRHRAEVQQRQCLFHRSELVAQALQRCRKEDVVRTFETAFCEEVKRLDVHFVSGNLQREQTETARDKEMVKFTSLKEIKRALATSVASKL